MPSRQPARCRRYFSEIASMNGSRLFLLLAVGLWTGTVRAQEMTVELDPAKTRIEFTLAATMHTVHGSFVLKHGTIRFDPSTRAASGVVVVDATSGSTDNNGRDRKMHREVLESKIVGQVRATGGLDSAAGRQIQTLRGGAFHNFGNPDTGKWKPGQWSHSFRRSICRVGVEESEHIVFACERYGSGRHRGGWAATTVSSLC